MKLDPAVSAHLARLGKRRWRGTTKAERSEQMGAIAATRWADMTPAARSAEMSRRRKAGLERRRRR